MKKSLLGLDSWIATAEEVSLQTASEGGKRRCRRDVLRRTVPNTGCSDWKGRLNVCIHDTTLDNRIDNRLYRVNGALHAGNFMSSLSLLSAETLQPVR